MKWISLNKQQPPANVDLLLATSTGRVVCGMYFSAGFFDWPEPEDGCDIDEVATHFMLMPPPPEQNK